MVKVLIGDMFESKAQTLVNTVNCVGVMGKGVALEFKRRFPEMFKDYVIRCEQKEVKLGKPYLYKYLTPPWILNFPTKDHWRSVANINDIERGLKYLLHHSKEWCITSLAAPPLGCGHGELEWRIVGPTLYRYFSQMDIPVELYAPYGTPHEELKIEFLSLETKTKAELASMPSPQWIRPAWVALVEILNRIEREPYHWPVGRTTFQKIAFVSTQEGLPTGLQYKKGSFGPFSSDVKGLITKLVNNGMIYEERLGRMFSVKVGRTFADARRAYLDDLKQWDQTIEKVKDLFMRMQTKQAEIVTSVLFAASDIAKLKKEKPTEIEVLEEIKKWKRRRRPLLNEDEVAVTIRNLAALKWLNVRPSEDLPLPKEEVEV